MESFVVFADALTCLGSGKQLWHQLINGRCGLSPASEVFPEWFKDNQTMIGTLGNISEEMPRLPVILNRLAEEIWPPFFEECDLVIAGSSLGDLSGQNAGHPDRALQEFLSQTSPTMASKLRVVSSACSSGTDVLSLASLLVNGGDADVVAVMAVDSLDPGKLAQHVALKTQSPTRARPFDKQRNGTSFGEGGAVMMVANRRGLDKLQVTPLAKVAGVGFSCDALDITLPDETGWWPSKALLRALEILEPGTTEIGYINAHGSGTLANDRMEAKALALAFGDQLQNSLISSTKGAVGHLLGATGLVEAVFTVWSLLHQEVPSTVGLELLDEELVLPVVPEGSAVPRKLLAALSATFGFGGVNSAVVFTMV